MPGRAVYKFGSFTLDREQRVLLRDGHPVPLRPKDFEMLVVLVTNSGRIVEKDELMKQVWPGTFVEEANLSHHVFTLRKALGDDKEGSRYIETIPRRGYRFVAPVTGEVDERDLAARPDLPSHRARRGAVAVAAGAVVAAAAVYGLGKSRTAPAAPVTRSVITLSAGDVVTTDGPSTALALSRDGTRLAYVANGRLYLRPLDRLEALPVPGVEKPRLASARGPFFSADGQWVGFWEQRQIKKVSVHGGAPISLGEVGPPPYGGGVWTDDNTILIGHGSRGVWRLSADGKGPEAIIPVPEGHRAHGPQLLPDGRSVLFTLVRGANWDEAKIVVQPLDGAAQRTITAGADARYLPTGHLVYALRDTVVGVRFDAASATITGPPVTLVGGVRRRDGALGSAAQFAISSNGTFAYLEERKIPPPRRTLVWVHRDGREEPLPMEPRGYIYPRISPDGSRLALDIQDDDRDIWVWDFSRRLLTPLTTDAARDVEPVWSRDGRRIFFLSLRAGPGYLFTQPVDGSASAEQFTEGSRIRGADTVTPDGKGLILRESDGSGTTDLTLLELHEPRGEARVTTGTRPLVRSPFLEENAAISPDGRWIAFQSNSSGAVEIYLRPFPNVEERQWPVSTAGGTEPLWAADSRTLFYRNASGGMMRVVMTPGAPTSLGSPEKLFDGSSFALGGRGEFAGWHRRTYDVSPDGRKFLMIKHATAPAPPATPDRIVIVQNWFEELKAKLPQD